MGTSDQRFSLRWNNYQSHLVTAFESLLEEKDFVDVTLGVEGRKLPAHKMLLSACSPYFRDLLKVDHYSNIGLNSINLIPTLTWLYSNKDVLLAGQPLPAPDNRPARHQVRRSLLAAPVHVQWGGERGPGPAELLSQICGILEDPGFDRQQRQCEHK